MTDEPRPPYTFAESELEWLEYEAIVIDRALRIKEQMAEAFATGRMVWMWTPADEPPVAETLEAYRAMIEFPGCAWWLP